MCSSRLRGWVSRSGLCGGGSRRAGAGGGSGSGPRAASRGLITGGSGWRFCGGNVAPGHRGWAEGAKGGGPSGPPGGLPGEVRVDRGKDFLSKTVASVLAGFAVKVEDLPGYTPHLKGSVETVNGAAGQMFCAGLPRYSGAQRLANGRPVDPG